MPETTKLPDLQATQALLQEEAKKLGRPLRYSNMLGEMVLEKLSSGETLSAICRDTWMPSRQTVLRWRRKFPEFGRQYLRAREDQTECWVDDCVAIADDDTLDIVEKTGRNGSTYEAVDHENIQRSKLRVETRWRVVTALNARYAPKQQVEHSGEISHNHKLISLSDREKMRRLALFMLEDQAPGHIIEGESQPVSEPVKR